MNNTTLISKISSYCLIFVLSIASGWALTCDPPTDITTNNVTQVTARAEWVAAPNATGYFVQLRTTGIPSDGDTAESGYVQGGTAAGTFFQFTNLIPGTEYSIFVRSKCDTTEGTVWSEVVLFSTLPLLPPHALEANYVSYNSYVALWEPSQGATQYELTTSDNVDFTAGPGTFVENVGSNLLKLISGLDPDTDYWYKVRARLGENGEWTGYSDVIDVHTIAEEGLIAIWNGTDWINDAEPPESSQPTINKHLIFEGDFIATDVGNTGGLEILGRKMTIRNNAVVTIIDGSSITILEDLHNEGSASNFIIQSGGNFKQVYSESVNTTALAKVHRNSFPIYRLDYTMWSSPVLDQYLLDFSDQTVPSRFYSYNSSTDLFEVILDVANKTFQPAHGYLIRAPNNWTPFAVGTVGVEYPGEFTGVINNGNIEVALNLGYNMVGNPYPSDIYADNLFVENSDIDPTLWFWRRRNNNVAGDPTTSYYATYSVFGGVGVDQGIYFDQPGDAYDFATRPNGYIKVGQGFLVKAKPSGNLVFKNTMRNAEGENAGIFLRNGSDNRASSAEAEKHKFYLGLTGGTGIDSEILLGFASTAYDGLDIMDAEYIGDSPIALTSIIDGNSYVIQAKALPFVNTSKFALRFQTSVAASYTISLKDVTGMFTENVDPILVDMLTNTETNLRNASYTFASEVGVFDTRFKIVFEETALSTVDVVANANAVIVMSKNNVLTIDAGSYTMKNVEIYDMLGRKIYSKSNIDATTTSISDLRAQDQIILVQITTDHGIVTKKVQF